MADENSMPSVETVIHAINALYKDPDTSGKERASVWLGELQKSVYAWKIADELLHKHMDLESCYFAAQTMRTKIQYYFHELPVESHTSLRDSLMEHLSKVNEDTAPVIVTQLSLAMADLALQMATWKTPVVDLISRFGSSTVHLPVLLEVLTVLPEEVNSRSMRLGANRRNEVIESFTQVSLQVIHLLDACIQPGATDSRRATRVFRCLGSWFSVGALPSEEPMLHKLLGHVIASLTDPSSSSTVHDTATDCICNALMLIGDTAKPNVLAQVLIHGVYSLVDAYHMSVAQEDQDRSVNYCRIFTELAESLLDDIVRSPGQGLGDFRTLDLLLMCVGHYEYEVAEITFNFWYRMSEVVYKEDNDSLNACFERYIQLLIVALCRHCQLDPDKEGVPDDQDDFGEFRLRVSDLIKDVIFLVGSSKCFRQMFENLKNHGPSATWETTEATLFVMAAVAKSVLPDEEVVVPQVVDAILQLPPETHVAVRYTSIQLLGELCEWIEKHPQYLNLSLNFLLQGLQQQPLASAAAAALQNICATCRTQMVEHFDVLLQIVRAADTLAVSAEASVGLLKGTVLVLTQMSPDKITQGLRELCKIQLESLVHAISQEGGGDKPDPIVWLDRLAAIFRHTNVTAVSGHTHPCLPVVEEVWPILSQTCNRCQGDIRVMERCCRCIRFTIRCVGRQSHSLLQPLVTQIVQLYQVHQHSCFLYLGSILVDEYGGDPACIQGLLDMLQAFCGPTFQLLSGANALRDHPDTVDDLFRLCTRFLQRAPLAFLKSAVLEGVVQCALAACLLDHKEANASVMKFLYDMIHSGRSKPELPTFAERRDLVGSLLRNQGQELVNTMVRASTMVLPTYLLTDVAETLYELLQLDRQALSMWLQNALQLLPMRSTGGAVTVTPEQLSEFLSTVTNAQQMKTVSTALREFSRLFR
ncbi:transportin-3-like [Ornithodoros turicata]|uniref:Transportin-3 n=1 Tax=Ornithodoros turicata TaxID=34597 RepID=A0A2R5LMY8_9ACAR